MQKRLAEAKAVRLIGMYLCSEPKLGTTVTAAAMMHNWVKAFYEVALLIRFSYFCDFKIKCLEIQSESMKLKMRIQKDFGPIVVMNESEKGERRKKSAGTTDEISVTTSFKFTLAQKLTGHTVIVNNASKCYHCLVKKI